MKFKNQLLNNKKGMNTLFLFIMIVIGIFAIGGISGSFTLFSTTPITYDDIMYIPHFGRIECEVIKDDVVETTSVPTSGTSIWCGFEKGNYHYTDTCRVTVNEKNSYTVLVNKCEIYPNGNVIEGTCVRIARLGREGTWQGTLNTDEKLWIEKEDWWGSPDIADVTKTYNAYGLVRYDGGAKNYINKAGCVVPVSQKNIVLSLIQSRSKTDNYEATACITTLESSDGFNHWCNIVTSWSIGFKDGNVEQHSQHGEVYCRMGSLYEITKIKLNSGQEINTAHNIETISNNLIAVPFNKIADVECCPSESTRCVDFKWVSEADAEQQSCPFGVFQCENNGNLFSVESKTAGYFECIDRQCVYNEKTVECAYDRDCGENQVCQDFVCISKEKAPYPRPVELPETNFWEWLSENMWFVTAIVALLVAYGIFGTKKKGSKN